MFLQGMAFCTKTKSLEQEVKHFLEMSWALDLSTSKKKYSFLSCHVLRNPALLRSSMNTQVFRAKFCHFKPAKHVASRGPAEFSQHPSSRRLRQGHEETRRSRRWTRSPHCSDPTCKQKQLFTIKNVPLLDPSLLMNDLRSNQRMNFPTWTQAESNMHVDVLCVPASHLKALELSENCWSYAWISCHFVDSMRGKVANHNLYDLDQFRYIYIYMDFNIDS